MNKIPSNVTPFRKKGVVASNLVAKKLKPMLTKRRLLLDNPVPITA